MFRREQSLYWEKYWRDSITDYKNKIVMYDKKIEKAEGSDTELECYQALKETCEQRIKECQANIKRLLEGGYGEGDFPDDGSEVAKWQKKAHPEQKSLPYREWKKKYGDKFTRPEYLSGGENNGIR